jgi:uncharacterized RDD family membrane protein YckC
MDNFQIETAQNVNIIQNVAGVGERILAFLIDIVIIGIYFIIISFIGIFDLLPDMERGMAMVLATTIVLPAFLYHLLWEQFRNGQSPGKMAMKIRVVKLDGSTPEFSNYLLRWLMRFIDINITMGSIAVVALLVSGKGQRLGDIAAGTTVITERKTVSFSQTLLMEVPDDYIPKYPQVTVFTDTEIQTIKNLFTEARFGGNDNPIIIKLSQKVATVMEVSFEETPIQFLDTIIKDYNYYTQNM